MEHFAIIDTVLGWSRYFSFALSDDGINGRRSFVTASAPTRKAQDRRNNRLGQFWAHSLRTAMEQLRQSYKAHDIQSGKNSQQLAVAMQETIRVLDVACVILERKLARTEGGFSVRGRLRTTQSRQASRISPQKANRLYI